MRENMMYKLEYPNFVIFGGFNFMTQFEVSSAEYLELGLKHYSVGTVLLLQVYKSNGPISTRYSIVKHVILFI